MSFCRVGLFSVFHTLALVGLTSVADCSIHHVGVIGASENYDWMFSLANKSVPTNERERDENEQITKVGTDRRLF